MKINRMTFTCLFMLVFLSSCKTVQEDIEIFNRKKICCSGYDDMLIWKWDGKTTHIADLKENAPIYVFDEGRSRFTALEFTSDLANLELYISAINKNFSEEKALFYPAITFLDVNKKKITPKETNKIKILGIYTSGDSDTTARASAIIPQGAKYAIIHSASAKFGQTDTLAETKNGGAIVAAGIYIYLPDRMGEGKFIYSPSAEINVSVGRN